ncbi:hypothetical protein CLIB1423_13S01354 [[Candida] railenensis]|uniref:Uncharacterized protein n=1 Tax=[Candida] railenensis TaxID=45579 RepID=A0A9P0QS32_9ASCO|nr:hypothetical protein CLIB1423_13S01354 [[Candida] railenensis]
MSIEINKDSPHLQQMTANLVPVHIQYTGDANTNEYFSPSKSTETASGNSIAFFRGLKLVGQPIELPANSTAYLVNKSESMVAAPETPQGFKTVNNYIPEGKLDTLVAYGHDTTLPSNSQYASLVEWDTISNIIHE